MQLNNLFNMLAFIMINSECVFVNIDKFGKIKAEIFLFNFISFPSRLSYENASM